MEASSWDFPTLPRPSPGRQVLLQCDADCTNIKLQLGIGAWSQARRSEEWPSGWRGFALCARCRGSGVLTVISRVRPRLAVAKLSLATATAILGAVSAQSTSCPGSEHLVSVRHPLAPSLVRLCACALKVHVMVKEAVTVWHCNCCHLLCAAATQHQVVGPWHMAALLSSGWKLAVR